MLSVVAGIIGTTGVSMIISAIRSERSTRRGVDLAERLAPFRPTTVADEAQDWLDRHH